MPEITPIRPDQIEETRRMIYTVAHHTFRQTETLEDTITRYHTTWPLHDLDEVQQRYFDDGGAFLVLTEAGRVIGAGGIHRLEDGVCEVKRVWLLPQYHGQGLGYRIMTALLDQARVLGYHTARLQTAPAYQPRAYAFYHRMGFRDIPGYGDDPDDVGMELKL